MVKITELVHQKYNIEHDGRESEAVHDVSCQKCSNIEARSSGEPTFPYSFRALDQH